eukprot:3097685-Prorocentrum_lima.AAC.1
MSTVFKPGAVMLLLHQMCSQQLEQLLSSDPPDHVGEAMSPRSRSCMRVSNLRQGFSELHLKHISLGWENSASCQCS